MSEQATSILSVLMHIFRNYMNDSGDTTLSEDEIFQELMESGFAETEINYAIDWLKGLAAADETQLNSVKASSRSLRVFSPKECLQMSLECRGLLLNLEQIGILSAATREIVIDRLIALRTEGIDISLVKWVSLMVLFNQGDQESALEFMQYITLNENGEGLQ
jgi:Smg protein